MSLATADQILLPRDPAAAMEAATKQYVDGSTQPDFITGLKLSYVDASHVQVGTGAAYVPGAGGVVAVNAAITYINVYGSGRVSLYLLPNGTILGSSVPPIAPYFGAAISLSGGRYLGSVLLSTAGLIVPFAHFGNKIRYMSSPANAPFRAINGSSNGVSTTVSLTALLPTTARIAHARALNGATGQAYIGNPDMGATSTTNYMTTLRPNTEAYVDLLTDATQNISWYSNGSQTLFLDVMGYEFER